MSPYPPYMCPSALTAVPFLVCLVPLEAHGESPCSGPEIARFIRQLGDESFTVRQEATKQLLKIGLHALPDLEDATDSGDPEICCRSWRIIDHWAAGGKVP